MATTKSTTATEYKYARNTSVTVDSSRLALRKLLKEKFGATQILDFDDIGNQWQVLGFTLPATVGDMSFSYMLHLPLPDPDQHRKDKPPAGDKRRNTAFASAYDQELARLWRVCLNLITAKLIAIQEGASSTEREFFADQVVYSPTGQQTTVYNWYAPQVQHLAEQNMHPPLLPAVENPRMIEAKK